MPEVLGNPPSPRTALFWNGTAWQWALVDAAGHIQIDVLTIAAGVDVATATNQALILAQLQLIEDMRDALLSVATDRLIVRGEDQLHSYGEPLADRSSGVISGADGFLLSNDPAGGLVWHITHLTVRDRTSATTAILLLVTLGGVTCGLNYAAAAIPANQYIPLKVDIWLEHDDIVHVYFTGGLVGDTCDVDLVGEVFTKE